jgi:hypothetical protein
MAKVESIAVLEKVEKGEALSPEEKQAVLEGDVAEPAAKKEEETSAKTVTTGAAKPDNKDAESGEKEDAGKKESSDKKESEPPKDDKKKGEETAKVETPKAEDWGEKSENELKKPEGEEDLTNFSPREKGLFYELRQQRRRAQRAETEARAAEFHLFQERKAKAASAKEPTDDDFNKLFEGKEEDDLLTVGEAKKVLEMARRQPAQLDKATRQELVSLKFERNLEKTAVKYPDAPKVVGLLDTLLDNDEPYSKLAQEEVIATYQRGGNFVQVIYNFIKGHPKFPEYEAKLTGSDGAKADSSAAKDPDAEEKKERARKLAENQSKEKSTGGAGGGDSPKAGEYTEQELRDMTPAQWAKLPAKTRKKLLEG